MRPLLSIILLLACAPARTHAREIRQEAHELEDEPRGAVGPR